jgi:hypothetical protein
MKSLLLLWLLLLCSSSGWAQTIQSQSFEGTGTDLLAANAYTSNTFDQRATSTTQYFTITTTNPPQNPFVATNYSFGSDADPIAIRTADNSAVYPGRFWIAEGVRGTSNTPGSYTRSAGVVTMNPVNASGYTDIVVTVALADPRGPGSLNINGNTPSGGGTFNAVDKIEIQYSTDGTNFTTIGRFMGNNTGNNGFMEQDVNLSGGVADETSPTLNYRMTDYSFSGTTGVLGSPASLTVRVVVDQGGGQELAFDNIRITGTATTVQPPTLSDAQTTTINYNEGDPATTITSTIAATNPAATTLSGATVSIGNGFIAAEDVLSFTSVSGITAVPYANGTLSFSGTAPIADYVTLLKSVKYRNSNTVTAKGGNRSIQFVVRSGASSSSGVIRNVLVRAVLDGPTTIPYTEDFTTDYEGTHYGSNTFVGTGGTGADFAFTRTNVTPYQAGAVTFTNISNGYYWYGVNTNSTQNSAERIGRLETQQVDATRHSNLHFQVRLGAESGASARWQTSDSFKMYYRTDGSSGTWKLFGSFRGTATNTNGVGDLRQDRTQDLANLPTVPAGAATLSPALTNYDFTIPADANGKLVDFKLELISDGTEAEFAFDLIQVTGTLNNTPTISDQTRSIAENSANGTSVGAAIAASDADAGQTLTYAIIAGNTDGAFAINSATGQLTVVNSGALNFEVTPSYSLTVQVTDNGTPAANSSATVTVNVTNVNEAPGAVTDVNPAANTVPENSATGTSVGITASATDPDGTTLTYSLTNDAGGRFAINASTGVVTVANGALLDFETTTSHSITVQASDGTLTSSQSFTIAVTDVDDTRPTVAITSPGNTNGGNTSTSPVPFTVTFSESVTGFVEGDLTVSGGTISGFSGSGTTYTFSVTPSGSAVTVNVPANVAQDGASNLNTAATQFSITYQQPLVATAQNVSVTLNANGTATLNASSVNNGSTGSGTLTYTIQKIAFGRVFEGQTLNLSTPNGANFNQIRFASYGTPSNNGNGNYSLGSCNAANSLATAQNSFVGRSSGSMSAQNGPGAPNNNPQLGDPCPGTPKLLAVQAGYSADAASLSYACSEAGQTNYVLLTVSNGTTTSTSVAQVTVNAPATATLSSVSPTAATPGTTVTVSGTNLSGATAATLNGATVTIGNLTSTGFTFVVPSGATSGNLVVSLPCSQTLSTAFAVRTSTPALTSPVNNSTTNGFPSFAGTAPAGADVRLYLNTQFVGILQADNSGNFSGQFGSALPSGTYTTYVTAQLNGQDVSANSPTIAFTVDSSAPSVAITSTGNTNGGSTSTAPIGYTVTFSESVTGFTAGDLNVSNGSVSNFSGSGSTYTFDVTPASAGAVTVDVPAGAATDAVGNGNSAATQFGITYAQPQTATPVVLTPANGSITNNNTPTYSGTATANSSITLYVDGMFADTTFANAAGNWRKTAFFPLADGQHSIYVTAQATGQAVSNNSNTNNFIVDTTAPTVTLTSGTGTSGSSTSTTPFAFTATFSENVTGFVAGDLNVTNGTVSGFSGSGLTYTFNVTPTTAGTATTVSVFGNSTQDAASNGNSASNTYSLTLTATSVTWNGSVSTDWFTAANWTPAQVPTASIDVTIPTSPSGGRFPVIVANASETAARNVSIASGASLSMSANTLTIAGNVTNNGTFTPTGGTVVLGTDALANIVGSSRVRFWNLTVQSNTARVATSAGASVRRLLTLNGNLTTNGNDFVLESSATTTAMVVNNGSNVINGNVTVQRYISTSTNPGLGYRHYAAPVSTTTVGELTTSGFTPVVNPAYNTAAQPGLATPFPTVYGYEQSRLTTATNNLGTFDKGWYSPAALSDSLTIGKGYTVNVAGGQTFAVTGRQHNGTFTQTLARGPVSLDEFGQDQAGWHLVGNPYPSPLNWSTVAASDRPNVGGAIFVFESSGPYAGMYRFYNSGIGTISPVLAQGQGFFVRVIPGQTLGSLQFSNANRPTAYSNPNYQRTSTTRPLVQLDLQGANLSDPLFVYFDQNATVGTDEELDAVKLRNTTGLNLSAVAGNVEMAINALPLPTGSSTVTVPLQVRVPATGTYTLHAASIMNLPAGMVAYLRDRQTGAVQDLSQQPDYTFSLNAAYTGVRFELFFTPQRVTAVAPASLSAQVAVFPNPAHKAVFVELPATLTRSAVSVALVDALGRTVLTQSLTAASTQLSLEGVAAGVYAVRLTTAQGTVTKKLTVE